MLVYWRVHYGSDGQTGLSETGVYPETCKFVGEFGDLTINNALESCFRIKRVPSDSYVL